MPPKGSKGKKKATGHARKPADDEPSDTLDRLEARMAALEDETPEQRDARLARLFGPADARPYPLDGPGPQETVGQRLHAACYWYCLAISSVADHLARGRALQHGDAATLRWEHEDIAALQAMDCDPWFFAKGFWRNRAIQTVPAYLWEPSWERQPPRLDVEGEAGGAGWRFKSVLSRPARGEDVDAVLAVGDADCIVFMAGVDPVELFGGMLEATPLGSLRFDGIRFRADVARRMAKYNGPDAFKAELENWRIDLRERIRAAEWEEVGQQARAMFQALVNTVEANKQESDDDSGAGAGGPPAPEIDRSGPYPVPLGATWSAVRIHIVSGEAARVKVGDGPWLEFHMSAMGLAYKQNTSKETVEWVLLLVLARNYGQLTWDSGEANANNKQRIVRLRKALRTFMGISEDPIPHTKGEGYKVSFTLRDCRPGDAGEAPKCRMCATPIIYEDSSYPGLCEECSPSTLSDGRRKE